ncbi:hypothetical protein GM415_04530 [Pseudodesulfovibrio cashew]|uniref:Uncharacterized protein n=1 Tax=Pseudodesulfovibrio cashew TaxID=2678688 RepID=A0A6I6JH57_9BACT|nr:hypothetical protein [Pseudodesulfovibrio cashew]QGY39417.1 hypothetical protein GM415_04530 [Pseudodesulfovibrio cashew]
MSRLSKFLLSFAIFVALCYGGLVWFVNGEVRKGLDEAVSDVDGLTLAYDGLDVGLADHTVTLTNANAVLPSGQRLRADEVVVTAYDRKHRTPHFVTARAKGLVIRPGDADLPGLSLAEPIKGDLFVDYAYDPKSRSLTIKSLAFDAGDAGEAALSGSFTQLDLDALRVEKLLGLSLKDLRLTVANGSFMDKLFERAANRLGMSRSGARLQARNELTAMADYAAGEDNAVAAEALRGLSQFVSDPGTLTVTAAPVEPVPCLYLFMGRDLYENLRLLRVTVVADKTTASN